MRRKHPLTRMINTQTGDKGTLKTEPEESRFNYMIYEDVGHTHGYWEPHEWERDGWKIEA